MSRTKTSSDASLSPPELVRLTFPDRAALEREIATNLRYGQVFVRELLKFPLLTDGVIVIQHPVSLRELRLPAQIVMVNSDGAMRGTGLALRAFGRAEIEQLEAFARESGTDSSARRASSGDIPRTTKGASSNSEDNSHLVSQQVRTTPQSSAANPSAGGRAGSDIDRSRLVSQPSAADRGSRTASSGVQHAAVQRPAAAHAADRGDGRPRTASSTANPALRRPAQEVDATPARVRSGANAAVRPAQEIDGRGPERDRAGRTPQPRAANARTASSGANAAVRRPIQEINRADLEDERERTGTGQQPSTAHARTASSGANAAVRRPAQELNRAAEPERAGAVPQPKAAGTRTASSVANAAVRQPAAPEERRASSTANLAVSDQVEADDWSDFEHGPEAPQAPAAARRTEAVVAKQPEPSVDDDDWSDFEHGPEPSALATLANVVALAPAPAANSPSVAAGVAEPELAAEADGFEIPYDLDSANNRAPSAAFVSSPHTAVTHRPPPKDGSEHLQDLARGEGDEEDEPIP